MRLIKVLGPTALAALLIAAATGTSTASANNYSIVFCENAELECENPLPNPILINAYTLHFQMLSTVGTVLCEKSELKLKQLNELSTLTSGHLSSIVFEGCKLGATACTVTVEKAGGFSFKKSGPLEATATSVELEGKQTTFRVKCGFLINNCEYGGSFSLTAHSTGGGTVQLLAVKAPLERTEGFFCPKTMELDASYTAEVLSIDIIELGPAEVEIYLLKSAWIES